MSKHLEIEYKTLLTKSQVTQFQSFFPFLVAKKQVNTYFDTASKDLQRQKWMIRIREVDQEYIFTAKFPVELGHEEIEFHLNSFDIEDSRICLLLKHHNILEPVFPIGTTTTYRSMYCDEFGCWCLDETWFGEKVDFEIEYELHAGVFDAKEHYLDVLNQLEIEYVKANSKFARMLEKNSSL